MEQVEEKSKEEMVRDFLKSENWKKMKSWKHFKEKLSIMINTTEK